MPNETPISHAIDGKSAFGSIDDRVGELAEAQHGVVARWQLLELGMGRGAIEGRIARGQLRRVQWGVYAVGHRPTGRKSRWMAAVLSAGPGAVLSHRSAATLWGILPPMEIRPEVTRATRCQSRSDLKLHCCALPRDEITRVDGIPTTSAPRTVLDVAGLATGNQMEKMLSELEVLGVTDRLSIPDLLERHPRKAGTRLLKDLLAGETVARGVTREELEKRFAVLLEGTDLPPPRRNADIAVGGRFFNVDCLWTEQRTIVELDGRAVHGTRRAFERDREKDRMLQAAGWRVVRVTWKQLRDDRRAVVADLRRMLRGAGGAPTL